MGGRRYRAGCPPPRGADEKHVLFPALALKLELKIYAVAATTSTSAWYTGAVTQQGCNSTFCCSEGDLGQETHTCCSRTLKLSLRPCPASGGSFLCPRCDFHSTAACGLVVHLSIQQNRQLLATEDPITRRWVAGLHRASSNESLLQESGEEVDCCRIILDEAGAGFRCLPEVHTARFWRGVQRHADRSASVVVFVPLKVTDFAASDLIWSGANIRVDRTSRADTQISEAITWPPSLPCTRPIEHPRNSLVWLPKPCAQLSGDPVVRGVLITWISEWVLLVAWNSFT